MVQSVIDFFSWQADSSFIDFKVLFIQWSLSMPIAIVITAVMWLINRISYGN